MLILDFVGINIALKIMLAISIIVRSYLFTHIADKNDFNLGGPGGFSFRAL